MIPATLALITAVGPPDCATKRFPANSAIIFRPTRPDVRKRTASNRPIPGQIEASPCQRKKRLSKGNPNSGSSKSQDPNTKEIPSSKHPTAAETLPMSQEFRGWDLQFPCWLGFDALTPPPPG